MIRTTNLNILCPVCQKKDGCLVADDGSAAICSRKSEGSVKKVGKGAFHGGWLHILGDFKPIKYTVPPKKKVDWNRWAVKFGKQLIENREAFGKLCRDIDINPISALRFYIGWHKGWLTIPVYSLSRTISGIQRRQGNTKRYMKHSGMGVFVPSAFFQDPSDTVVICEGFTDTVTAIEYGLNAIGKMNAFCGNEEALYYIERKKATKVFIFADNDDNGVGLEGAKECRDLLVSSGIHTQIFLTPEKDLRASKAAGLSLEEVFNGY